MQRRTRERQADDWRWEFESRFPGQPEANYMMRFYVGSLKEPILVIVRFVFYHLPIDPSNKSMLQTCCSKLICNGCAYSNRIRSLEDRREQTCPFCRDPLPEIMKESDRRLMKRVDKNDPISLLEAVKR
jgi:hypothetical protein